MIKGETDLSNLICLIVGTVISSLTACTLLKFVIGALHARQCTGFHRKDVKKTLQ